MRAVLPQRRGRGNLDRVAVKLPKSLALDADNAQSLCEYADGQKDDPACPTESIVGTATAYTPIRDKPLTGPVYFVKHERTSRSGRRIRTLPALVMPLRGQVALNLRATSSVKRSKLVTTFAGVPDAPVSRSELRLKGGKHGILAVNGRPCRARKRQVADLRTDGHNARRSDRSVRIKLPCRKRVASRSKR